MRNHLKLKICLLALLSTNSFAGPLLLPQHPQHSVKKMKPTSTGTSNAIAAASAYPELDKKIANKTEALSAGQQAELEKINNKYVVSPEMDEAARNNIQRGKDLETLQIKAMSQQQFQGWSDYQKIPDPYIAIQAANLQAVTDQQIAQMPTLVETNRANNRPDDYGAVGYGMTQEQVAALGITHKINAPGTSIGTLGTNAQVILAQQNPRAVASEQVGNLDNIQAAKESSIDMLINATAMFDAGKITKDQYIAISRQVSQAADYSNKVSQTADSNKVSQTTDSNKVSQTTDSNKASQTTDSNKVSQTTDSNKVSQTADSNKVSQTVRQTADFNNNMHATIP